MLSRSAFALLALVIVTLTKRTADAKRLDFDIDSGQGCFQFVSRFCFAEAETGKTVVRADGGTDVYVFGGMIEYSIRFNIADKALKILLFFHDDQSWEKVYDTVNKAALSKRSETTCYEKYLIAQKQMSVLPLSYLNRGCATNENPELTGCIWSKDGTVTFKENAYGTTYVNYTDKHFFTTSQARYLYFTIVNTDPDKCENSNTCDGPIQSVSGSLHMTNWIDSAKTEFSNDEYGLDTATTIFFALELANLVLAIFFSWRLCIMGKLHYTVQLLVASILMQTVGLLVYGSYLWTYEDTGRGDNGKDTAAVLLWALSDILLLAQLILLAKGWTVVRRKLSAGNRLRVAVILTAYAFIYIAFLLWHEMQEDEAQQKFTYDSEPGHVIVVMHIFLLVWFVHTALKVLQRFGQKRRFYMKLIGFGCFWFIGVPFVFAVSFAFDLYMRKKWILGFQMGYTFLAHFFFIMLYNPYTKCNKGFPFHALTSDMKPRQPVQVVSATQLAANKTTQIVSRTFTQPFNEMNRQAMKLRMRLDQLEELASYISHRGIPLIADAYGAAGSSGRRTEGMQASSGPPAPSTPVSTGESERGRADGEFFWKGPQSEPTTSPSSLEFEDHRQLQ